MSVIFIVLPLALAVVFVAVVAYIWSARNGQFDDLDTPAVRMLHDDDVRATTEERLAGQTIGHRGAASGERQATNRSS